MKHSSVKQQISVIARAPFHIYYEGPANSLSATNSVGVFDILPGHADLFSVLMPCEVSIDTDKDVITFAINGGIVGVRNDEVMLFVNM